MLRIKGWLKNIACIGTRDPFTQHHWVDHCKRNVTHQAAVTWLGQKECRGKQQTAINVYFPPVEGPPSKKVQSLPGEDVTTTCNNKEGRLQCTVADMQTTANHSMAVATLLSEYGIRKRNGTCEGFLGWMEVKLKNALMYMAKYSSLIDDKSCSYRLGVKQSTLLLTLFSTILTDL